MRSLVHDARFALRLMLKQPGQTAVLVFTLALGIGATSTIFSLVEAVLLRPFPFAEPDQLVRLHTVSAKTAARRGVSLADFDDLRAQARSLASLSAYITFDQGFSTGGPARQVKTTMSTPELFPVLGISPHLGRFYTAAEDKLGGDVYKAVVSYGLWQSAWGGDPSVLGRTIKLRGATYEVIGVAPPGFEYPDRSAIWVPLQARYAGYPQTPDPWWLKRDVRIHDVIARLAPGVEVEGAGRELEAIAARIAAEHPATNAEESVRVTELREVETGALRPYLFLLGGAVILVLLIACVNVANLLLARALAREREMAVRTALGAGRWTLVRGLLVESVVLALPAALAGLLLASWGQRALLGLIPVELPFWMKVEVNGVVLAFTLGVAVAAALLFGSAPAWFVARRDLHAALRDGARGATSGATRLKNSLVVGQVAFSFILLVGAGLLMQSFIRLQTVDTGFDRDHLLVVKTARFHLGADKRAMIAGFGEDARRIMERLTALPGVTVVGAADDVPFVGGAEQRSVVDLWIEGGTGELSRIDAPMAGADVTPGFFAAMGIPLREGRLLRESDDNIDAPVVVVNQYAADTLWPGRSAIGKRVRWGDASADNPIATVVGVVGNTRWRATETRPSMELYYSYREFPMGFAYVLVRTAGDARAVAPAVRKEAERADPEVAVGEVKTMTAHILETMWQRRLWGALLVAFAVVALGLSGVGLYGVMSHLVLQRRREIGVRLALGATPAAVRRQILRRGVALFALGAMLGIAGAIAVGRLLGSLLFGVSAWDPLTFGTVTAVLGSVALLTSYLPARRAAAIDPIVALGSD